jgi:hypothetical protein
MRLWEPTYPRLELHAQGIDCARKRVARLMPEVELVAKRPRHRTVTTKSEEGASVAHGGASGLWQLL